MSELLDRIAAHFDRLRPQTLCTPEPGKFIKHPYGIPAGFYDQLWDWDGFFINTHLANRPVDAKPEYFQYWVLNFVSAHRDLGYPPGCVTQERPEKDRRDFSLKPFMGQSALIASQHLGDFTWIEPHYDAIVEIVTRRETTHRDEATGLYFWDDAMASGADNNAADSNLPETRQLYLSCDLNTFQWKEYSALATIAEELGKDSTAFKKEAEAIKKAMQEYLWNEEKGSFDNRRRDTGAFVNCVSYSDFVPLWAGLGTADQANRMFDNYLLNEEEMLSEWGARSLSRKDRGYNNANIIIPYSNWCGPIWPIANYFYFIALKHYGRDAEARDLAERVAKLLLADLDNIGSMHESYCAETGATLAPSSDQAPRFVEGGFIGWNLLAQDMLEQSE